MIIDIVHKEGKPQEGTEEKAGCCRVLCSSLFVDSWLQGKNVVGVVHKQQGWQQPWENHEKSWFKNLGELLEEWTDAVLLGCCIDVQNAFFQMKQRSWSLGEEWKRHKIEDVWSPVRSPHTLWWLGVPSPQPMLLVFWSTVFYQVQSQHWHLPGDFITLYASICRKAPPAHSARTATMTMLLL